MTKRKDLYGSRPHSLSKLLSSLNDSERHEVITLTRAENDQMTSLSLNRFPLTRDGVDWDQHTYIESHHVTDMAEAEQAIENFLQAHTRSDSVVVTLWDNLALPSLALSSHSVQSHINKILDTSWGVWLFVVDEAFLIEFLRDGFVTIGRIPEK